MTTAQPKQLESALLRSVLDCLPLHYDCEVLRLNAGAIVLAGAGGSRRMFRGAPSGTPDLLVLLDYGRSVWLELKTQAGKVTPAQVAMHSRLRKRGQTVYVVRSLAEAIAAVKVVHRG